mgnify:CR=1 FL=1
MLECVYFLWSSVGMVDNLVLEISAKIVACEFESRLDHQVENMDLVQGQLVLKGTLFKEKGSYRRNTFLILLDDFIVDEEDDDANVEFYNSNTQASEWASKRYIYFNMECLAD